MLTEILSIIAVCISGITAICSACVPAILNAKTKREELALKRKIEEEKLKHEKEQANEAKFEEFYQSHLKVLTNFSSYYVRWKNVRSEVTKSELVSYVSRLSEQFRDNIQKTLNDFAVKIKNCYSDETIEKEYKTCLNLILDSFGVDCSTYFPDILLPDILKSTLRIQFNKLQSIKEDCFGRLIYP